MNKPIPELSVSEFVALFNQTMEYAYNGVIIQGELVNFKVSKGRWVYFSLKDDNSKVDFFGSVYALPGPLEDGMLVKVKGIPRLHSQFGFSVNFSDIKPMGTGSIKRLNDLLIKKLEQEGLFALERKRPLAYPPSTIGLITSTESAAITDFSKIINDRWMGLKIDCYNVSVQGDQSVEEIVSAINYFSNLSMPPEVLVIIRGGGSSDDLASFNDERVVRAVANSRVATMVAIGHEKDVSLAELVADCRASTPSNAAELLVPDKRMVIRQLIDTKTQLNRLLADRLDRYQKKLEINRETINNLISMRLQNEKHLLDNRYKLLKALNPKAILNKGYALVRFNNSIINNVNRLKAGDIVSVELANANFESSIIKINKELR